MGNAAGVRRDFEGLEQRRLKAAKLLQRGVSQAAVARQLGVGRSSVNRWAQQLEQRGRAGLKKAGRAGRKPRLQDAELAALETALKHGAQALGYETNLLTAPRVARLIEQLYGVRYHPAHVWRILGRLGWSCQRPVGRALERDEPAIKRWKRYRWAQLKKKPAKAAAPSSSSTRA